MEHTLEEQRAKGVSARYLERRDYKVEMSQSGTCRSARIIEEVYWKGILERGEVDCKEAQGEAWVIPS